MAVIEQLTSTVVYQNKWLTVKEDTVVRPSGAEGIFGVVEKPDFAVIVPIVDGSLVLVEQYRYPLGRYSLELPQGACEAKPNMSPEALARQELQEETGYVATQMLHIGKQALAVGFCDQWYNIYVARDLEQQQQNLDPEEEGLRVRHLPISDVDAHIASGKIIDATSTTAYCLAKFKGLLTA